MNNAPKNPVTADELAYYKGIIAKNLLKMRSNHRLTQAMIGEHLGLTASGYGDYERGRVPEAHILYALAIYYDVPVAVFFADWDSKGKPINAQMLRNPMDEPIADIADGLKAIAENVSGFDKLRLLEERIAKLEAIIISNN